MTTDVARILWDATRVVHVTPLDPAEWADLTTATVHTLVHHYTQPDIKATYRTMARDTVEAARTAHTHGGYTCFAAYGRIGAGRSAGVIPARPGRT
jgi:hypothetical protein